MQDLKEKESRIEHLIRDGNTGAAVRGLYELIIAYAEIRDFAKAETLRDRLYEVDPMAIREIAQSGDIIEQKKSQAIDTEHMQLWAELYNQLSLEESNTLYYSLTLHNYEPDSPLFREGDTDRHLYFLDKGLIRLSFQKRSKELYMGTIGPGDPIGAETFFARTRERTFTATPATPITINALHPSETEKWQQEANNLPSVLYDFCFRNDPIADFLKEHKTDRRKESRVPVQGSLAVRVMDNEGNPLSRPFKGEFQDISSQGISFSNSFKKKSTAHALLGRWIALKTRVHAQGSHEEIRKVGQVVAVQSHPFSEYTFHVRFDRPVPQKTVSLILPESTSGKSPDLDLEI